MTITEHRMTELRSSESISCFAYASRIAMAAAIVEAFQAATRIHNNVETATAQLLQTSSSLQQTQYFPITGDIDVSVFEFMNSIYGDLLSSQHELDDIAAKALYRNLWDMYE